MYAIRSYYEATIGVSNISPDYTATGVLYIPGKDKVELSNIKPVISKTFHVWDKFELFINELDETQSKSLKEFKDFYHRRFNLLVCSTIIESGIDIPTANTIIINRVV